ncbi:achaete-scute homolog 4 [Dermochelys coriacea]|uniref:achaete-scute homolog 4 n=1 Tax=Dermochelys coriacea TaxID=27794 RepID=UPI001CA8563F|nr:achaete-scute homolog 4 [Dermochelys coriacea]
MHGLMQDLEAKFETMDSNKDNGLLNGMLFSGTMSMGNNHVNPHGLPLREPFGVPFHFDPSYWDQAYHGYSGRFSYIPFSGYVGVYDYSFEPAFVRKRNERERQRVRCVNEGYTRLREHLPKELADKRLSKVETLRAAINYIKHLQSLLDCQPLGPTTKETISAKEATDASSPDLRRECNSDGESKTSLSSSPYSEFEETCI